MLTIPYSRFALNPLKVFCFLFALLCSTLLFILFCCYVYVLLLYICVSVSQSMNRHIPALACWTMSKFSTMYHRSHPNAILQRLPASKAHNRAWALCCDPSSKLSSAAWHDCERNYNWVDSGHDNSPHQKLWDE